jgi:hypothetical protein
MGWSKDPTTLAVWEDLGPWRLVAGCVAEEGSLAPSGAPIAPAIWPPPSMAWRCGVDKPG